MYSVSYDGFFPTVTAPGETETTIPYKGWELGWRSWRFSADSKYWTTLLVPTYLEFDAKYMTALEHEKDSGCISHGAIVPVPYIGTSFWLTSTASAVPKYWETDEPPEDLMLLRGVRQADVRFTSQKGILLDRRAGILAPDDPQQEHDRRVSVGFADGSASMRDPVPLDPGPLGWGVERPFGAVAYPIMTTRNGVYGRDF